MLMIFAHFYIKLGYVGRWKELKPALNTVGLTFNASDEIETLFIFHRIVKKTK